MTTHKDTINYLRIYAELIAAATYGGTTSYQALAQLIDLPVTGNQMGKVIGEILGDISDAERAQGRPMLSAVCVSSTGRPGPGFFGLAEDYGCNPGETPEKKLAFWEEECAAVYKTWARTFRAGLPRR